MKPLSVMDWWQRPDLCFRDDQLHFAGRNVQLLVNQCGTPSFVYSAKRFEENIRRIKRALTDAGLGDRHTIHYAMKANRFAPLLTYLKQTGLCGIDACSPAEVEHAVGCGFEAGDISFTATSLSQADFDILERYGDLFMDCDSLTTLREWGRRRPGTCVGIRVNPAMGVGRGQNDKLQYAGGITTKFGIYREQFGEALSVAKEHGLKVTKIHFHTGCGYLTPQLPQLDAVIAECQWFIREAPDVTRVNMGGGLGVPHLPGEEPLDLDRWAAIVARHFGGSGIHVEVEPGDYIAKDAGLLLVGKTLLERKRDTWFLGLDAGFNIAPEPAHYGLPFQPVPLRWTGGECAPVTVVGHINEALDVWYRDALLPDMTDATALAIINAGAYSSSMSSNHCMRGRFKEFLLL